MYLESPSISREWISSRLLRRHRRPDPRQTESYGQLMKSISLPGIEFDGTLLGPRALTLLIFGNPQTNLGVHTFSTNVLYGAR